MPIPSEALELENRSIGVNGEPTLAAAYDILKDHWDRGLRDRELALHLFFLSWYGLVEPSHLTGFSEYTDFSDGLHQTLSEVHGYLEPQIADDAEILYVVGLAAHMFWFMFGDSEAWQQRALDYRRLYRTLAPNGIDPTVFRDRGASGHYYAHQAAVKNGY
jgi:hypothetical protein